ncbi:SDR family oxidoreductase [Fructilactobacillus sp. Tb1]|uniref:SDR family oxidoreductase n=1 Tax=Fructilactobacillus sp. Tb1 TaxID=3422304 RepID=UPI003D289145
MAIKDKIIVITGASSGIGEASAKLLAKHGAKVVLGARHEDKLEEVVNDITKAGGQAVYQVTDVTKADEVKDLVELAENKFGKLDVIFNNAGIMPTSDLSNLHTEEWNRTIDINLKGVLNGIAAVLPIFDKQKSGQVVTTSSVAGIKSFPGAGVYGATKYAVHNVMNVLRMESAKRKTNIRTTTLYPGAIDTDLLSTITDKDSKENMDKVYQNYAIGPDAVARAVDFAVDQPENTDIADITIYPTKQGL